MDTCAWSLFGTKLYTFFHPDFSSFTAIDYNHKYNSFSEFCQSFFDSVYWIWEWSWGHLTTFVLVLSLSCYQRRRWFICFFFSFSGLFIVYHKNMLKLYFYNALYILRLFVCKCHTVKSMIISDQKKSVNRFQWYSIFHHRKQDTSCEFFYVDAIYLLKEEPLYS